MVKTGVAFGDYISTGNPSRFGNRHFDDKRSNMREFLLPIVLFVTLGILFIRLIAIQLIGGNYYRNLSDNNRIKTTTIHGPRGIIMDRNNVPLVFNIPGYRKKVNDKTMLIGREKALELISKGEKGLEVDTLRQYPYKEEFGHVLGYIGQISKVELQEAQFNERSGGDLIGKMGIEQSYEKELVGIDGKNLDEVDSMGKKVRTLGKTDPMPGQNVVTTLDSKLQHASFEALPNGKKGAVIVTNKNGEVLALVSKPSFDPNLFTLDETYKPASESAYTKVSEVLLDSQNQPLLNRAISGRYPPGSTFKLITAASGLENNSIDENYQVEDTGMLRVGDFSFANWYFTQYGKTEGLVNIVKAIKRSNDIFFYKVAEKVGVDKLSLMAQKFGIGKKSGIDLAGEDQGIVPTQDWKKKAIGEPWYLGDTYHYGIGQGYLLVTPLQVNMWTSAIANSGVLYQPHLIKSDKQKIIRDKFLNKKTVDLIREGMVESCSTGGVAWPLFEFKVNPPAGGKDYRHVAVACKTGTAQHGGEDTPPHAWITLFAPANDPQIVVTVLVESSGEGSNVAAPVAKKVLEEWFSR